ncbi:nose resistant to fluoxetine protein 6-like [Schistocerca gregaria]|uniref:nose resistant to fluoxetine protein 6-like n=1 Tax=Schistocerca gregaria TaxID=7010 RepID=UPI00211E9605|nr:nose resistant to fluoxetine protein 6-like [Schistocerca gregaria]
MAGSPDTGLLLLLLLLVAAAAAAAQTREMSSQCEADSRDLTEPGRNISLRTIRMLESWGQLPVSGLLEGNTALLGNFDECLDAGGKYCLASVRLQHVSVQQDKGSASLGDPAWEARLQLSASGGGGVLRWAVCAPESCSAGDAALLLRHKLQHLLPASGANDTAVDVPQSACSVADAPPLAPKEWAFLSIILLVCVVVIISTIFDLAVADTVGLQRDSIWLSFSARKNWCAIMSTSRAGFTSLHGLKFLSMAWVMLFHTNSVVIDTPAANSNHTLPSMMYDWTLIPLANGGNLAVNTFFVASGLLLSFTFLRERARGRPFGLLGFYLHRYLRLTPPYAAMMWLYATVLPRLAAGPLWHEVAGPASYHCSHDWWRNLLYVNNYQRMQDMCMTHSWYLAADMQLYWASPLLLWPMFRWPRLGRALLLMAVFGGTAAMFCVTFVHSLPWADVHGLTHDEFVRYLSVIYQPTYWRIVPYVTGMAVGWVLFRTRDNKCNASSVVIIACWAASTGLALCSVYGLHLSYVRPYNRLEAAFFASLRPLAWSLSIAWVIYACEKGRAGPVKTFLSWNGFQPLAKLCYGAYLVQYIILFYDQGVTRTPITYGRYYVVHKMLGDMALTLALAAILSLAFEMPALNLDKALLRPGSKSTSEGNTTARDNQAFSADELRAPATRIEMALHPATAASARQTTSP